MTLYEKAVSLNGKHGGNCVEFIKKILGLDDSVSLGNARDMKPNVTEPIVGDLVLFKGHVGIVIGSYMEEEPILIIAHSNGDWSETVEIFEIPLSDKTIKGFRRL